jgi:hypothetical protein
MNEDTGVMPSGIGWMQGSNHFRIFRITIECAITHLEKAVQFVHVRGRAVRAEYYTSHSSQLSREV